MVNFREKNNFTSNIAAVLMLVIMGVLVLAIMDAPGIIETSGKRLCSERFFDNLDCSDWLAENDAKGSSSYSFCFYNGISREMMYADINSAGRYWSEFSIQLLKINHFYIIEHPVQIKLLI